MTAAAAPPANEKPVFDPKRAEAAARYRDRIAQILADWRARWPAVFTKPVPLAIGISRHIKQELGAARPKYREIGSALHYWTNRNGYLRAVARGEMRRNLDGSEAGIPDEETRAHARQLLAQREQRDMERARHKERVRAATE